MSQIRIIVMKYLVLWIFHSLTAIDQIFDIHTNFLLIDKANEHVKVCSTYLKRNISCFKIFSWVLEYFTEIEKIMTF